MFPFSDEAAPCSRRVMLKSSRRHLSSLKLNGSREVYNRVIKIPNFKIRASAELIGSGHGRLVGRSPCSRRLFHWARPAGGRRIPPDPPVREQARRARTSVPRSPQPRAIVLSSIVPIPDGDSATTFRCASHLLAVYANSIPRSSARAVSALLPDRARRCRH
jgi:hypothetical protein